MANTATKAALALAVAGLFAGCASTKGTMGKTASAQVKCSGVNECKGHGACAGADNSCKAMNSCKGTGWVEMSKEDCAAKGGKVVEAAAKH